VSAVRPARSVVGSRTARRLAALAVLLAASVYAGALPHPFVWDDIAEVETNTSIEHLSHPLAIIRQHLTRPLVNLSYAVDYRVWGGPNQFGFHLTNLLLHLFDVLLLFSLTWHVVRDRAGPDASVAAANLTAFTAAGLLAVHPLMTEAVGYVSSRSELLCGLFVLAGLHAFRLAFERYGSGHRRASRLWQAAALACVALALAAKETAVMVPFVLLVYDRWLRSDPPNVKRARLGRLHVPFIVLVLVASAVRIWVYVTVEHPGGVPLTPHPVLSRAHLLVRYLALLFVPVGQSIVPKVVPIQSWGDARVFGTVVVLLLAVAAVWFARRRSPLVSFGLVSFFLFLLPSSVLTLLSNFGSPIAEHRLYVASFGIFMAAGAVAARLAGAGVPSSPRRRAIAVATLTALLVVLAGLTVVRNRVWADPVTLWTDAAAKAPDTWLAVQGLAEARRGAGDCEGALPVFRRAIELQPQNGTSYMGMAGCLVSAGRVTDAADLLRLGMQRAPRDTSVRMALADLEERYLGDRAEALRLCQSVLGLAPGLADARKCVDRNR
jgi:protein O-mannosyl-transferase